MPASLTQLTRVERTFNGLLGWLAAHGIGPGYLHELTVRGRKSGRLYTAPVNLIEQDGRPYLVAPRGRTQWTLNAEAAGEIELKRGSRRTRYAIRVTSVEERPALLKLYLDRFASQVQRFFDVPAGSEVSAFTRVAADHPVYELIAKS